MKSLPDGAPRQLTTAGGAHSPRWSPSGRWLAYHSGANQVWVTEADRGELRRIGDAATPGSLPTFAWSPVEDRLAYVTETGALVVESADGSERRELTPPVSGGSGGVGRIAWSLDGQWLAYDRIDLQGPAAGRQVPGRVSSVWRVRADGSDAVELVNSGAPEAFGFLVAGWTPNGSHILYQADPYSASLLADGARLFVASAGGGPPVDLGVTALRYLDYLAPGPAGSGEVAVVAGGFRAAWTNKALRVLAPATGEDRALTDRDMAVSSPAWSPDGRRIA